MASAASNDAVEPTEHCLTTITRTLQRQLPGTTFLSCPWSKAEGEPFGLSLPSARDDWRSQGARSAERRKRVEPKADRAEKAARRRRAAELGLDLEAIDEVFERLGRMSRRSP